ncbi:MAG: hypothetical protein F2911_11910 [Actinobacteria bacterium]|nr:hypothetical protein [Actinomycetota bacterium]
MLRQHWRPRLCSSPTRGSFRRSSPSLRSASSLSCGGAGGAQGPLGLGWGKPPSAVPEGGCRSGGDLRGATLTNADLTGATLTSVIYSITTCPNGSTSNTRNPH